MSAPGPSKPFMPTLQQTRNELPYGRSMARRRPETPGESAFPGFGKVFYNRRASGGYRGRRWRPPREILVSLTTTYRVKAYLSKCGHLLLDQRLEEQRQLYNAALEERLTAWRMARTSLGRTHQSKELTAIRAAMPEYGETHRRISVGTLDRLDRAYQRYTRSLAELGRVRSGSMEGPPRLVRWDAKDRQWRPLCGQPRFKSGERFRTLECHAGAERFLRISQSARKGYLRVKGLPRLEFRWDERLPMIVHGTPTQPLYVKITRTARRVTISMSYAIGEAPEKPATRPVNPVGLHPGVTQRMTVTGDGSPILLERRRRDLATKARLQRKQDRQRRKAIRSGIAAWERTATGRYRFVWRRMDGSDAGSARYGQGYRKTRRQAARLDQAEQETNIGLLHEVSSQLVREHDAIFIEAPGIRDMTRSAAGDLESPGEGVNRQRQLNRSVLEQTWGRFAEMLEYKAERAGIPFVRVPSPYMSQTCGQCGVVDPASRRSRDHFHCVSCGFDVDAEDNAAHNVLAQGLTMLGPGAGGTPPRRRPPRLPTGGVPPVAAENPVATGFT